jgi:hypothetical protein
MKNFGETPVRRLTWQTHWTGRDKPRPEVGLTKVDVRNFMYVNPADPEAWQQWREYTLHLLAIREVEGG